jgi:2-amino-4-hydroxy-6-hydroxymethyldihydropteridine diphosphokinase
MTAGVRRAWIGLGANLGDPLAQLRTAVQQIRALPDVQWRASSSPYRSAPLGPSDQPDDVNAVIEVATSRTPQDLLAHLLAIERAAGRVRGADRWGPRVLDLDLLHLEGVQLAEPTLRLPHPELQHRAFVLVPWAEIAPETELPGLGRIDRLAAACAPGGLARLDAELG